MQSALAKIQREDGDWLAELGDVGQVVRELKADLIADLGGEERVSTAQRLIIEQISKSWTLLQSIDSWLLARPIVNKRNRVLFPVVLQRQTLEDSLVRNLKTLGLERRATPPRSLPEYLANQPGSDEGKNREPDLQAEAERIEADLAEAKCIEKHLANLDAGGE